MIEGEKIGKYPPSLWHFARCVIITAQLQIFDQLINQWVHLKNNETCMGENDKIHMCYELNKYVSRQAVNTNTSNTDLCKYFKKYCITTRGLSDDARHIFQPKHMKKGPCFENNFKAGRAT